MIRCSTCLITLLRNVSSNQSNGRSSSSNPILTCCWIAWRIITFHTSPSGLIERQFELMKETVSKIIWSAADYAANSVVQQTWAREVISKLKLRGVERILDVGCGDGKVTAELARAVSKGSAVGIDASPQMIEFANRAFPTAEPFD